MKRFFTLFEFPDIFEKLATYKGDLFCPEPDIDRTLMKLNHFQTPMFNYKYFRRKKRPDINEVLRALKPPTWGIKRGQYETI